MQMKQILKSTKGFTLVELIIVIIIVGILATVSVPVYRGYTKRAMASEGKALCGAVASAEKVYYAEYSTFYTCTAATNDALLAVDARMNKYFTAYTVGTASGGGFTVTTNGAGEASGISVTYTQTTNGAPTISETGVN